MHAQPQHGQKKFPAASGSFSKFPPLSDKMYSFAKFMKWSYDKMTAVHYPNFALDALLNYLRAQEQKGSLLDFTREQVLEIAGISLAQHVAISKMDAKYMSKDVRNRAALVKERADFAYLFCLSYNLYCLSQRHDSNEIKTYFRQLKDGMPSSISSGGLLVDLGEDSLAAAAYSNRAKAGAKLLLSRDFESPARHMSSVRRMSDEAKILYAEIEKEVFEN